MSEGASPADEDALIVVDVQIDFCPGGALAVPRGDEIIPIVNSLAARFRNVVLTEDWHPRGHASFASSHPGKKTENRFGVLRPASAVARPLRAGRPGAQFHRGFAGSMRLLCCARGSAPRPIRIRPFTKMTARPRPASPAICASPGFLAGFAFGFCVRYSTEDARREGFAVFVVEDACRAIDLDGSAAATRASLAALGVPCLHAREFA